MLTIKEIKYKNNHIECNSCGKVRQRYFEIRYGIPVRDFPWQPYTTLPLCTSCIRRLGNSIDKKLAKAKKNAMARAIYSGGMPSPMECPARKALKEQG